MFCEGDKTYPENVGCPVCGMDLVKSQEMTMNLKMKHIKSEKKFWISTAFTLSILFYRWEECF